MSSTLFKPLILNDSDLIVGSIFEHAKYSVFFGNKFFKEEHLSELQNRLGIEIKKMQQQHTITILEAESPDRVCDGIFTNKPLRALMVRTADCLPLLAVAPDQSICALHCGRKGLVDGIINQLSKTVVTSNADSPWQFYIGPHIHDLSYEVGEQIYADIRSKYPLTESLVIKGGKKYFSLKLFSQEQIALKFHQAQITEIQIDTFANEFYNSYRENKTSDRNLSLIWKRV